MAVTDVTASAPLYSSGGSTPNISETQAGSSTDGWLSSADWNKFNSKEQQFTRTPVNANYTTIATDFIVAVTDTSSARTITLGSAATFGEGNLLVVKDESGGAGTHNITVSAPDTVDSVGSITINVNYGVCLLYSSGAAWFTL